MQGWKHELCYCCLCPVLIVGFDCENVWWWHKPFFVFFDYMLHCDTKSVIFFRNSAISVHQKCKIFFSSTVLSNFIYRGIRASLLSEMAKNSPDQILPGLWNRGPLKDLKDSKLILNESNLFPWSSIISLVPFRTFRSPLFA